MQVQVLPPQGERPKRRCSHAHQRASSFTDSARSFGMRRHLLQLSHAIQVVISAAAGTRSVHHCHGAPGLALNTLTATS